MKAIKKYRFSKEAIVEDPNGDYIKLEDLKKEIELILKTNYCYEGHKILTKKDFDNIIDGSPPKEHYPWQD